MPWEDVHCCYQEGTFENYTRWVTALTHKHTHTRQYTTASQYITQSVNAAPAAHLPSGQFQADEKINWWTQSNGASHSSLNISEHLSQLRQFAAARSFAAKRGKDCEFRSRAREQARSAHIYKRVCEINAQKLHSLPPLLSFIDDTEGVEMCCPARRDKLASRCTALQKVKKRRHKSVLIWFLPSVPHACSFLPQFGHLMG